tara:strand:+ start:986 stop:1126 length:141 start_codon:yes stop_codon:yes gene_type:complete
MKLLLIALCLALAGCAGYDTTIALDYTGKDGRSIGTKVTLSKQHGK